MVRPPSVPDLVSPRLDFDQGPSGPARQNLCGQGEEALMPTETVIVVAGVVAAFVIFSLALWWADHTTRKL